MNEYVILITTAAGGTSTDTTESPIIGRLYAVDFELGTLASGAVDVTLTYKSSEAGVTKTLLTLTNLAANATYYPREQVHGNTGTGLTLDGTRIAFDLPIIAGTVTATTAQGGDTKSGSVKLYVIED